jgi:hypothetical protein
MVLVVDCYPFGELTKRSDWHLGAASVKLIWTQALDLPVPETQTCVKLPVAHLPLSAQAEQLGEQC